MRAGVSVCGVRRSLAMENGTRMECGQVKREKPSTHAFVVRAVPGTYTRALSLSIYLSLQSRCCPSRRLCPHGGHELRVQVHSCLSLLTIHHRNHHPAALQARNPAAAHERVGVARPDNDPGHGRS